MEQKNAVTCITTTKELDEACQGFADAKVLAMDTEFMRRKTFYPVLCLFQIASPKQTALVDCLAHNIDLTSLIKLLKNKTILKVFHSASHDIEACLCGLNVFPEPVFDTQLASMFLATRASPGYDYLVRKYLGVSLNKTQQTSDWYRRPLTSQQLCYARDDVVYLYQLYECLVDLLKKKDKYPWYAARALEEYGSEARFRPDPEKAWRRMQVPARYTARQRFALQKLAALREEVALEQDIPRPFLQSDENLVKLAEILPAPDAIKRVRYAGFLTKRFIDSILGRKILRACENFETLYERVRGDASYDELFQVVEPLTQNQKNVCQFLKLALQAKSQDYQISPDLLANQAHLEAFVRTKQAPFLARPWQYETFGQWAEKISQGHIALKVHNGKLVMHELQKDAEDENDNSTGSTSKNDSKSPEEEPI